MYGVPFSSSCLCFSWCSHSTPPILVVFDVYIDSASNKVRHPLHGHAVTVTSVPRKFALGTFDRAEAVGRGERYGGLDVRLG
jgi:hypothetical protein